MNRRTVWRWGVAGTALSALGAGVVWRQRQAATSPAEATAVANPTLWQLRFDRPEGGELAMDSLLGQPLLLNFWGSWCPPCVAEMPELDRFAREMAPAGWRVLGLAVDNPKAVRSFLAAHPVGYTIALAGFEGADLSRRLGNLQGGLPYTVLFNAEGKVVQQKAGPTSLAELQRWALAL